MWRAEREGEGFWRAWLDSIGNFNTKCEDRLQLVGYKISEMRVRRICVAVLLLPLLVTAQQRPVIPSLAETIDVSLVNVDVFVTSKSGERVRGLTKDDFEIFENGNRQPISNFAEFS